MADTILEQIADAIVTQLQDITVANGYEVDINSVIRETRSTRPSPVHHDLVLIQGERTRSRDHDSAGATAWRSRFIITAFVILSDEDTSSIDEAQNQLSGSIEKALMENVQWADLAIDTELEEVVPFGVEDGSADGIVIEFDVIYRVAETDPYINRI